MVSINIIRIFITDIIFLLGVWIKRLSIFVSFFVTRVLLIIDSFNCSDDVSFVNKSISGIT